MSDCCLTPTQQFSAIYWREQVNFQWDDDEVRYVLDQHAELDFYSDLGIEIKPGFFGVWNTNSCARCQNEQLASTGWELIIMVCPVL